MTSRGAAIAASILSIVSSVQLASANHDTEATNAQPYTSNEYARESSAVREGPVDRIDGGITVRPGTLADLIDTLAGGSVRVVNARVVGVFDPQVFLVESQTRVRPIIERNRVLVFIQSGALRVEAAQLVASTVTISGTARTLLGMQTSREVPWPVALTREAVQHLEIRAAVLARSVKTPEGIDLVVPSSSRLAPPSTSPPR